MKALTFLEKIKTHRLAVFIIFLLYAVFGSIIIFWLNSAIENDDILFGVFWFLMLLLLIIVATAFDKDAQPFLCIYSTALLIVIPLVAFVNFIVAVYIVWIFDNKFLAFGLFLMITVAVCIVFYICGYKKRFVTEEKITEKVKTRLVFITEEEKLKFEKNQKFYRWHTNIVFVLIYGIGKHITSLTFIFIMLVLVVQLYYNISLWSVYKAKYKSRRSLVFNIIIDNAVYMAFSAFAVLLSTQTIVLPFKTTVSDDEIAMLIMFGTISFAKVNSFALYSIEHRRIKEKLEKETTEIK